MSTGGSCHQMSLQSGMHVSSLKMSNSDVLKLERELVVWATLLLSRASLSNMKGHA